MFFQLSIVYSDILMKKTKTSFIAMFIVESFFLTVSEALLCLLLSHWYPGSGVAQDCIDS